MPFVVSVLFDRAVTAAALLCFTTKLLWVGGKWYWLVAAVKRSVCVSSNAQLVVESASQTDGELTKFLLNWLPYLQYLPAYAKTTRSDLLLMFMLAYWPTQLIYLISLANPITPPVQIWSTYLAIIRDEILFIITLWQCGLILNIIIYATLVTKCKYYGRPT